MFRAKLRTLVCKPPVNCSVTHKPLDNKNNGTCYDCYQFVIKRLIEIAETRINTGFFKQLDLFNINKDGVPELVVQYPNGNKYGVVVYTYKKGKVVRMTSKKGYIGISSVRQQKGKKYLVLQWTQSRQSTGYDVYQMKGTKLKRVYRYTYKYESLSEFNQGGYAYIPRKNGRYIGYNNYDKFERSLRDCIYQDYEDWMDFCY